MKTTVSEKGQVTIPKALRESLGIRPGDAIEFSEKDGCLIGTRILDLSVFDKFRGIIKLPDGLTVDDIIDEMRGGPAAWFDSDANQLEFLGGIGVEYSAMESRSAHIAGRAWKSYRNSGGARSRMLGDFLIAGHAQAQADRLLTRDRGFFRNHFTDLEVIEPT